MILFKFPHVFSSLLTTSPLPHTWTGSKWLCLKVLCDLSWTSNLPSKHAQVLRQSNSCAEIKCHSGVASAIDQRRRSQRLWQTSKIWAQSCCKCCDISAHHFLPAPLGERERSRTCWQDHVGEPPKCYSQETRDTNRIQATSSPSPHVAAFLLPASPWFIFLTIHTEEIGHETRSLLGHSFFATRLSSVPSFILVANIHQPNLHRHRWAPWGLFSADVASLKLGPANDI